MFNPERDLLKLRREIVLGGSYDDQYKNTFGLTPKSVKEFFDGFLKYIEEEAGSTHNLLWEYCNKEMLLEYYDHFDEFPFETVDDEEEIA